MVVGLGVLILLALGLNNRISIKRQLSEQEEVVNTQVAALEATRAALQAEIDFATSEAAVEEWAYTEARMIREGDNLIVPISPHESTPTPSVSIQVTTDPMETWEAWLALFFDPSLP